MSLKDNDESSWSLSLPFWATEKDQRIKNWGERLRICEWEGGEMEEDECDHITTSSGSVSSMAQKESINSTENSINSYRQSHGWKVRARSIRCRSFNSNVLCLAVPFCR
jgi:hypothetical protein